MNDTASKKNDFLEVATHIQCENEKSWLSGSETIQHFVLADSFQILSILTSEYLSSLPNANGNILSVFCFVLSVLVMLSF